MKEKIEIESDHVRLLRLTPSGQWSQELEIPLRSFVDLLVSERPAPWDQHPILPPGSRWYGHKQRAEVLLVEEPPTTRRIRFAPHTRKAGDTAPESIYELSFPYVILAFYFMEREFEEMKIFYRVAPLASLNDVLHLSNLFNVQLSRGHHAHNRACLRPVPDVQGLPLHEQVQRLVSHFWQTEFNLDIEDNGFAFYSSRYPGLATLEQWELHSRRDPLFVLQFPWEAAPFTVRELVDGLMEQRSSGHWLPYSARNLGDLCYAVQQAGERRLEFDHNEGVWKK